MKTNIAETQLFPHTELPVREGPYKCHDKVDADNHYYRWFDGVTWSGKLDFDPDLDDEVVKPGKERFYYGQAIMPTFVWCGLVDDPVRSRVEDETRADLEQTEQDQRECARDAGEIDEL